MLRSIRKVVRFFATHHQLEYLSLVIAIFFITLSASLGLFFYPRYEAVNQLLVSGEKHLQLEELNLALADFKQANDLAKIDLKVETLTLSQRPQSEINTTNQLEISHLHFVKGLGELNKKDAARAIAELNLVDKQDANWSFAQTKLTEAKNFQTTEKEVLAGFDNYYQQSLASCQKRDYQTCLNDANSALSLVSEDYHFDQSKVDKMKEIKKQARDSLAEQKREAEARRNAFTLKVPILMYHYIRINPDPNDKVGYSLSVTPDDFEQQMAYLAANGYQSIDVATIASALHHKTSLPSKSVVITFDDGYRDFYTTAFPILKKYNLHGEAYLITGFLGGDMYMTWDMVREIAQSGLVTIGSHTVHHKYLTAQSLEVIRDELTQSKTALEANLGIKVTDFCYPYGAYNDSVAQEVAKAGYSDATTTVSGLYQYDFRLFSMSRRRVSGGESLQTFINSL